jgi:hypothetical protein
VIFSDHALFDGATFTGRAAFVGGTFTDDAAFRHATFSDDLVFDINTMADMYNFTRARFHMAEAGPWIARRVTFHRSQGRVVA